ncbi:unnamed protein product, partial [Phaeothamnion confervicola]
GSASGPTAAALEEALGKLGRLSAVSQGLQQQITSFNGLLASNHRVYVYSAREGSGKAAVLGYLKVGSKDLFLYDPCGRMMKRSPLCVLDFYVCEACQRRGVGATLFAAMLGLEGVDAATLAYDKPSPKLLPFLLKHYRLEGAIYQPNRYVVFGDMF